jgi:hypothetical protein
MFDKEIIQTDYSGIQKRLRTDGPGKKQRHQLPVPRHGEE